MKKGILFALCVAAVTGAMILVGQIQTPRNHSPQKAPESRFNDNPAASGTSRDLTKADVAWHAKNTYGWDCHEVVERTLINDEEYYTVECANGNKLRVYPRLDKHPRITNMAGDYE